MAAFGGHPGGLHAAGSATHHHDMATDVGGSRWRVVVVAQTGVDGTDRPGGPEVLGDTDEAVDAWSYEVGATGGESQGQVGVRQELATHGDQVGAAVHQDPFAVVGTDAAHGNDGNVHGGLHGACQILVLAFQPWKWPVGETRAPGGGGVGGHVDGIGSGSDGHSGVAGGQFRGDAVGHGVVPTIQPDQNREIRSAPVADCRDDLDEEAGPAIGGSAVSVGAAVPGWRQERRQQVSVAGVHLHAVQSGGLDTLRGVGEPFDHLVERLGRGLLVCGHLPAGQGRHSHELVHGRVDHDLRDVHLRNRQARDQRGPTLGGVHAGDPSVVVHLDDHPGAMGMDSVGQSSQPVDHAIV